MTDDKEAKANQTAHGLIQRYIGPDHKVIDMKAFFAALVQALRNEGRKWGHCCSVLKKSHLVHICNTWCISLPYTAGPSFRGTRRSPAPAHPPLSVGLLCDHSLTNPNAHGGPGDGERRLGAGGKRRCGLV
jgi:hypothetical protein